METGLRGTGGGVNGGSLDRPPDFAPAASQRFAVCGPVSPGRLVEGADLVAGKSIDLAASDLLDLSSESNSRSSCVIDPEACRGCVETTGDAMGAPAATFTSVFGPCTVVSFVSSAWSSYRRTHAFTAFSPAGLTTTYPYFGLLYFPVSRTGPGGSGASFRNESSTHSAVVWSGF